MFFDYEKWRRASLKIILTIIKGLHSRIEKLSNRKSTVQHIE